MTDLSLQLKQDLLDLAHHYDAFSKIDPKTSYFKRFPTCQHVQEVVCADQSRSSKGSMGAYGEAGGAAMAIPWEACSQCPHYKSKNHHS